MTKKFRITISAGSKKELSRRILENVKRGFEVVKRYDDTMTLTGDGFTQAKKFYAIMEKDNLENKKRALGV